MSYDVHAECPHCGNSAVNWNYTSNMAGAWRAAGCDIAEFDGKPAAELCAALEVATAAMRADPERYRAFDSPNGWGTMKSLVPALDELHEQLSNVAAGSIVRVCR